MNNKDETVDGYDLTSDEVEEDREHPLINTWDNPMEDI